MESGSVEAATRDIASAASRLLLDNKWNGFDEVPLLGPADISFNEMAEIMSNVLGKEIRFQQTTFEAYKERFIGFGMSEATRMKNGLPSVSALIA